jgi:ankyrin repeat protein
MENNIKTIGLSLCLILSKSIQSMQLPAEIKDSPPLFLAEFLQESSFDSIANPLNDLLMRAVIEGHKNQVELLLNKGANPNHLTEYGSSMLIKASLNKDVPYTDIMQNLLKHGAIVGHKNKHGMNPLMIACKEGHTDQVSLLLRYCKPEDRSATNNQGETALMLAAASGNQLIIPLLAAYPLEIERTNNYGETALIYWLENPQAHPNGLKKLLELQAQADVCDRYKNTALSLAVQNHEPLITRLILKNLQSLPIHRVDQLLKNSDGYTFLEELRFCKKNRLSHSEIIQQFIKTQTKKE